MKYLAITVALVLLALSMKCSEPYLSQDVNDKRMVLYLLINRVPLGEWEPAYIAKLKEIEPEQYAEFLVTDESSKGYFLKAPESLFDMIMNDYVSRRTSVMAKHT